MAMILVPSLKTHAHARARAHTCTHAHARTHTHKTREHTCTHVRVHSLFSPQIQNLLKVTAGCGMSHKIPKIQNMQHEVLDIFHIKYSNAIPNTLYTGDDNFMVN
jgi:hypothetical protein